MINKITRKIKEKKGISVTVENLIYLIPTSILIGGVIFIFAVMYTDYNLNNFTSELVRTAELHGRVGEETSTREEELQKSLNIKPMVTWSRTGNIGLNEPIELICSLDYKVDLIVWETTFRLEKKAIARSEVYWKTP